MRKFESIIVIMLVLVMVVIGIRFVSFTLTNSLNALNDSLLSF